MKTNKIVVYFSFRSPYSWLGCYRFSILSADMDIEYQMVPVSPLRKTVDQITPAGNKLKYILRDVKRIAAAYGLEYTRPDPFDCDWTIPHAAFLEADRQGQGLPFIRAMYHQRFCDGMNISSEPVIRSVAETCNLDAEVILGASRDKKNRRKLLEILASLEETGVFGVPVFRFGVNLYWGNDRLEWLFRDVYREIGKPVPDLSADPLARPF
ncbi:MAG: DsbA family protein [Thiotrichales bacterium]|nr:DsbA family protein [Thiotrichales bacterium]